VWSKPLPSPSEALVDSQAHDKGLPSPSDTDNQSVPSEERSETGPATEGLGKGLPSPREEKSRAAKRSEEEGMQGEGTGGALVPSEEEVLTFGREFRDLARGMGPIPEDYALRWYAFRASPKAGPWPRDWQGDLRRRFVADSVASRGTHQKKAAEPAKTRAEIEAELKNLEPGDPRRGPLLEKLNQHAA
jgi:hypothetical protein